MRESAAIAPDASARRRPVAWSMRFLQERKCHQSRIPTPNCIDPATVPGCLAAIYQENMSNPSKICVSGIGGSSRVKEANTLRGSLSPSRLVGKHVLE